MKSEKNHRWTSGHANWNCHWLCPYTLSTTAFFSTIWKRLKGLSTKAVVREIWPSFLVSGISVMHIVVASAPVHKHACRWPTYLSMHLLTEWILCTVWARANKRTGTLCFRLPREQFIVLLKMFPEDEERVAQAALSGLEIKPTRRLLTMHCNVTLKHLEIKMIFNFKLESSTELR